jgi:hypothetical protein
MKWDDLTMSQKQALMKIYVNNGVTNLDEIRNHYNRFDEGGFTNPYNHGDSYTESTECAYFSNHTLNDQGYMMSGNAWTPRGGDIIYNGFDSQNRPSKYNEGSYDTYAAGAVKDFYNNFNTKDTLDVNKVYTVNMYYKPSRKKEKAFKEGKDVYGTHTGYLSFDPKDNQWYVTHNIHGVVHKQRFFDLQRPGGNIGITAVFEPRKNTIVNRVKTKLGFAEGGPKEVTEPPTNTVMYSRTPRELVSNIVNTRPVTSLTTMTEVPRVGAGVSIPITEAINNMIARRTVNNTNVINTDSIVARRPISYIGMPTRINKFEGGGNKNPISKRIVDRVHADGFYGGTTGIGSAVKQFIFNKKGDPERRINEIENYYISNEDYIHNTPYEVAKEELSPEEFIKFEQAIRLPMLQQHKDALNIYLGHPQIYNTMEESPYQNIVSKDKKTYQINDLLSDGDFEWLIMPAYSDWKYKNENELVKDLGKTAQLYDVPFLNHAGLSEGFDSKKGHYVSLFDTWDYNTKYQGKHGDNIGKYIGGKPFDLYHRYYLDEWMDIPEDKRGSYFLPEIIITPEHNKKKYGGNVNRFDEGGSKNNNIIVSDNTRVQMPRTDVEPIRRSDEELRMEGWREQTYPDGETYMAPPLATGALTPVYPEFELLTGIRSAATGLTKGVKAASKVSSKSSSKAVKINSKITADNLADITDEMWDEAYNAAIANNDLVEAQRLRDLHFKAKARYNNITFDTDGNPIVWYTGSEWGGHNVFDSSKMNATIGGSSVKGDKGNFLTTDLPSAERYAGHSRYNTRTVDTHEPPKTAIDKIKNALGLYKGKPIHPVNRISEDLQPDLKKLYDTRGEYVIDRVGSDKVKSTVYPMYVNAENVRVVDFQGNPWSSSPITPKNSFVVNTETKNNVLETYIRDSKKFSNKEEALQYYNSLDETHGPYFDYSDLESRTFVDRERSINKWSGNPNYNKAELIEIKTPSTTNGIVQESFLDGYNTVYMPNVIDSNGGIEGISYAIDDLVTKNSNQMKLANFITYTDDGTIIPLSKRDNFLNPDIRYVLAPAFMTGTGYGIYNTTNNTSTHKYGGKIKKNKK